MPLDETPSRDPHEPPMEMAEEAMAPPDQSPSSGPSAVAATKENGPVSSPSLTKGETEQRLPPVASANDTAEPSIFHHLKWITWPLLGGVAIPIVTQNENGPCPLVAISNVLLLKRKLTIPSGEEAVQAPRLLDMIGNAMIENVPKNISEAERLNLETNMNDAMLILDRLRTGLDVNVQFSGCRSFEYTPECIIFDLLGIPLYHGWVIDPQSQEYPAVNGCSYNQLVERIFCDKETTDDSDK
ncbi:unnamed protein product [Cyprideis torosa]|uniref:Ubiquitin carboxyl-terminal hydrolase n=1 Tax=Cyprideis torosa TaxID=163714 RepID=A0A7R8W1W8_9CRUS|nr:unnamed protein product [Cyprideis torosa]CAG0880298.1 unnamed protein product [Cyprideis torosa]